MDFAIDVPDSEERPRLAWCRRKGEGPAEESACKALEQAVTALAAGGYDLDEIELPDGFQHGAGDMRKIFYKECLASFRPELEKGREGLEAEKFDIAAMGEEISEADYQDCRRKIQDLKHGYTKSIRGYDALLTFSVPHKPPIAERAIGFSVFTSVWTVSAHTSDSLAGADT